MTLIPPEGVLGTLAGTARAVRSQQPASSTRPGVVGICHIYYRPCATQLNSIQTDEM